MASDIITPAVRPKWRAELAARRIYPRRLVKTPDGETKEVSSPIDLFSVVLLRGEGERIPFHVSWPKGRPVFSDSRECLTGTSGSTGVWGTRPPSKAGNRRALTSTGWVAEVSRLIGIDEAERIVRVLSAAKPPFSPGIRQLSDIPEDSSSGLVNESQKPDQNDKSPARDVALKPPSAQPPSAHSIEEEAETAAVVGFPGGSDSQIRRSE
jgi:hypothetical protein